MDLSAENALIVINIPSILDGKQVPECYEDPENGTIVPVTCKTLTESYKRLTSDGRSIVHGFAASLVRIVGMITTIHEFGDNFQFNIYDGTSNFECIMWSSCDGVAEFKKLRIGHYVIVTGQAPRHDTKSLLNAYSARPVINYNAITAHMLECIQVALERNLVTDPTIESTTSISDNYIYTEVSSRIKDYLQTKSKSCGRQGVHIDEIAVDLPHCHEDIVEALDYLMKEGEIYTTVDYSHYMSV
ncbi:unnamed protein product [Urochloa humidicola]